MSSLDQKIIELNKQRALLLLLGSCACVVFAVWVFWLDDATIRSSQLGNPRLLHLIAMLSILFFGANVVLGMIKLLDKKPGLVFDSSGIVNNSSGVFSGLIPWSEIEGAQILEIRKQKLLVIKLSDPQKYLERGGRLKRVLYGANYKMCGSPIVISPRALKISFFELIAIFNQYQQKYLNGNEH